MMDAKVRAAVLKTLLDAVKTEYDAARAAADGQLASAHETDGVSKVEIRVPGSGTVATMTVGHGKAPLVIDQDQLLAWMRKAHPTEVTVRTVAEIRPSFFKALLAQLEAGDGLVVHTGTGEVVAWAKPGTPGPATTTLSFATGGRDRVMAAWRDGQLDLGPLLAIATGGQS